MFLFLEYFGQVLLKKILNAWHEKILKIVSSLEILDEYSRVSDILAKKYSNVEIAPFINLIIRDSELFTPIKLKAPVSRDPDDDKFIAVALAANCHLIVSGDNDLLSVTGYKDIEIINPNEFVKKYLKIEKLQLPQKSRTGFFIMG